MMWIENNSVRHFRTYQSLLLTGNNLGLMDSRMIVSGVFYLDPASDFGNNKSYRLQLYNFNYRKRLLNNSLNLVLGRQSVITASVFGRMDGLSASYSHKKLKSTVFAGGYIPGTGFTGDPLANHLLGAEVRWLQSSDLHLSAAWSQKAHAREVYKSIKTYRTIEVPATIQNRLGLRFFIRRQGLSLYAQARVYPASGFQLKDFNTHVDYQHGRIDHLSFEIRYFEPRVPDNSIFSVFDAYNTTVYRLSSDYKLTPELTGFFQVRYVQFNDDHSQTFNIGLRGGQYFLQVHHQEGYGGISTHVTARASMRVKDIVLFSRGSLGNYRLIEGDPNDLATLVLGSRIPLHKRMFIKTEVQLLRNEYYRRDTRFLFNLSYRF